jgi:hypothetical protein
MTPHTFQYPKVTPAKAPPAEPKPEPGQQAAPPAPAAAPKPQAR